MGRACALFSTSLGSVPPTRTWRSDPEGNSGRSSVPSGNSAACVFRQLRITRRSRAVKRTALNFLRERRSEEHTSELQSRGHLVCRLLLEKKNNTTTDHSTT